MTDDRVMASRRRSTMKTVMLVMCLTLAGAVGLAVGVHAQGAKAHSMTGCLQKGTEANTFMLTNVEGKGPKTVEIVASTANLTPHIGHKIEITGTTVSAKAAVKAEEKKVTKA